MDIYEFYHNSVKSNVILCHYEYTLNDWENEYGKISHVFDKKLPLPKICDDFEKLTGCRFSSPAIKLEFENFV